MSARGAHNWLLRLCALALFVSGGALAQRLVKEIDTQLIPLEFPREKHNKAVAFEVRQPEPIQVQSAVGPARVIIVTSTNSSRVTPVQLEWLVISVEIRTFDALAPPHA
jgi:hypothetical protein